MKPDQHKQKRSSQYKQKHGIGNAPKSKGDSTSNHHNRAQNEVKLSKSKTKGKGHPDSYQSRSSTRNQSQSNNCNDDESSLTSEDSDDENSTQPRKAFRRREITSNWQRYEMPEKERGAEEEILGEDFNKLMSSAGSAISQFRFRDEQDWLMESTDDTDSNSGLLAVNTDQISEALQCIPLYEVLRLDKSLFSSEQIEAIDVTAKLCKDAFETDKFTSTVPASKLPSKAKCDNMSGTIRNSSQDSLDVKNKKSVPNIYLDSLLDVTKTCPPLKKNVEVEVVVSKKPVIEPTGSKSSAKPVEADDGELDFLLSLEKPVDNVSSTQKQTAVKEDKGTEKTKELEDWLDSVLDA